MSDARSERARPGRLVLLAIGISDPGTMGGNSRIAIEMARQFAPSREVLVVTTKPETFRRNDAVGPGITLAAVRPFAGHPWLNHPGLCRHLLREVRSVFEREAVGPSDAVFSISDGLWDVWPGFVLRRRMGYLWAPSLFLFVPSPLANLLGGYGFPRARYVLYWVYQRLAFALMRLRGDRFVLTNAVDRARFPRRLRARIHALYGGVDLGALDAAAAEPAPGRRYEALFCGRLHPQKGLMGLLHVWREVRRRCSDARLGIIGNGAPGYEQALKRTAERLGIDASIDWLGYVDGLEKYRIYRASAVFVHSTVYDNNGMVAAEALCAGLPVVRYDLPALRRIYERGCRSVPPGDRRAFAAALAELIADDGARRAVAPDASTQAALRARWSWARRARRFERFLFPCPAPAPAQLPAIPRGPKEPVTVVTVVRDPARYARCLGDNRHLRGCTLRPLDNGECNEPAGARYNRFLDGPDAPDRGWIAFCHEDFEPLEPLDEALAGARTDVLYGPLGAVTTWRLRCWPVRTLLGRLGECNKDGSGERRGGRDVARDTPVDVIDGRCLLVHTDLLRATGLRFDPNLTFDLHVEEFCMKARAEEDLPSHILPLRARCGSHGPVGGCDRRLARHLRRRYPETWATGISSYALGTPPPLLRLANALKRLAQHLFRPAP